MANSEDGKARAALTAGGTLLLAAGASDFYPGFQDAILAFLNNKLSLGFPDPPDWFSALILLLGILLLLLGFFGPSRTAGALGHFFNARQKKPPVIAIKEIGFAPSVRDISPDELPPHLEGRVVQHLIVDVSQDLSTVPAQLEAALSKQLRVPDQLAAIRSVQPDSPLAFCGIIQAPFQILAGFQLSSWVNAQAFEWDRNDLRWQSLHKGNGPSLRSNTQTEIVGTGDDVAIAIEVSFNISTADIVASVPTLEQIIRIGPALPRLDCVTHEGQVIEIASQFRSVLNNLHSNMKPDARIHVFAAAPMSVGFGLGRVISRTFHPPVIAYTYERNARPPYQWGLLINASAGAPQVVRN